MWNLFYLFIYLFIFGAATQRGPWPPLSWGFLDHTQRRTTVGKTPLNEWLARHRDLYLTTHNTHNRQTSMPPVGFETTISAGERPQTYALDRAATGTGIYFITFWKVPEDPNIPEVHNITCQILFKYLKFLYMQETSDSRNCRNVWETIKDVHLL